ncbi:MAG: rubredoxin [Vallitaleaceae bacterium]|nr:rubredoxin [Vallitaleaceae bacterium]
MALFKCTVCNYIYEGENTLDKCPMCGAPKEKMEAVSEDTSTKIYRADFTNGLHTDVIGMATSIIALCEDGIEDNLDPMCVNVFNKAKDLAWEIKQLSKAEISNHVRKEKY